MTLYPAFAHRAHPLHNTCVPITAATLAGLHQPSGHQGPAPKVPLARKSALLTVPNPPGQPLYFHLNHPLRHVTLAGPIVAFDEHPTLWVFFIDDGSGVLAEVKCPRAAPSNAPFDHWSVARRPGEMIKLGAAGWLGRSNSGTDIDMRGVEVGAVVRVEGGLGTFRGNMQVTLDKVEVLRDTAAEVDFWEKTARAWETLGRPWSLNEAEIQVLREEADGTRRAAQEKAEREVKRSEKEERRRLRHEERARRREARAVADRAARYPVPDISKTGAKDHARHDDRQSADGQRLGERIVLATQEAPSMAEDWRAEAGLAAWTTSRDFCPDSMLTILSGSNRKGSAHADSRTMEPSNIGSSSKSQEMNSIKRAAAVNTAWADCVGDSKHLQRIVPPAKKPTSDARGETKDSSPVGKLSSASGFNDSDSDNDETTARRRAAMVRAAWEAADRERRTSLGHPPELEASRGVKSDARQGRELARGDPKDLNVSLSKHDDDTNASTRRAIAVSVAWEKCV